MKRKMAFVVIWLVAATAVRAGESAAAARPRSLDDLAGVLERHVEGGLVDYAGLSVDRADLDRYLDYIATAQPELSDRSIAMAFWINAYNAVTLKLVLDHHPGLRSVMDVPGFFEEIRTSVGGELLTLDEIEKRALESGDPRVHFAVVCASYGCPDLRAEPFEASTLDRQLDEQTRGYLADPTKGARLDPEKGTLWLSSIFKWYGGDFTGGSDIAAYLLRRRVLEWVEPYLPVETSVALEKVSPDVRYLDYDWGLNEATQ